LSFKKFAINHIQNNPGCDSNDIAAQYRYYNRSCLTKSCQWCSDCDDNVRKLIKSGYIENGGVSGGPTYLYVCSGLKKIFKFFKKKDTG